MRVLAQIAFCSLLATIGAQAQRGGGHGGGGMGRMGGGMGGMSRGMGGMGGMSRGMGGMGGMSRGMGGMSRGGLGGFRGGFNRGFGFRGNRVVVINRGFGFGNGFIGGGIWGWPAWGWPAWGWPAWGWTSPDWSGGWAQASWPGDYTDYGYGGYPADYGYGSSPNAVVADPQVQAAGAVYTNQARQVSRTYDQYGQPVYANQARPVSRTYDAYGQQVGPSRSGSASTASPIYLIALKNQTIYAALAYSVKANTLSFVTLSHEQKMAPLDLIDRSLSMRLNRERHVDFQLPPTTPGYAVSSNARRGDEPGTR